MLEVEGLQPAKRRTGPLLVFRRGHAPDPAAYPVAQVMLELFFEAGGLVELAIGRFERPVGVAKPPIDKAVDRVELGGLLLAAVAVAHRELNVRGLQVKDQLGPPASLIPGSGVFELVFGAGIVAAAIGPAELLRQRGADPRPQDEDREVGLADVQDLGLEGFRGAQQAALPQIGFEDDKAAKLELQPLDHRRRHRPLGTDISRRRHKNPQAFQNHPCPGETRHGTRRRAFEC